MHRMIPLLAATAFIASPVTAQEEAPAPPSITVEGGLSDTQISERLSDILAALGRDAVTVGVEAGVVTLSGEVAEEALGREAADIAARLDGVVAVRNDIAASAEITEQLDPAIARFRTRIEQALGRLPLILLAATVFALVTGLGLLLSRLRIWNRLAPNSFIAGIYRQGVRVAFGIAGLVVSLDVVGATALLGTILGAAGLVGLAIGFAVRDTVENFVASVMLSLRQPFKPNDLVEIEGDTGRVIRLTSRATILLSLDGNHVRIPNAVVFKSRIINYTRNPERRFSFDIGIDPEADLEATRRLAQDRLVGLSFVLPSPEPIVWIENITEAGAILRVSGWIDQNTTGFPTARGDAIRLVKDAIEAAGVSIPDTTYRIRLEGSGFMPVTKEDDQDKKIPDVAPRPEPIAATSHPSEENALIALVQAERAEGDDLLSRDAPLE